MSLLEQGITKNRWVEENISQLKFEIDNKKKYKVKEIHDRQVYAKELEVNFPSLYL